MTVSPWSKGPAHGREVDLNRAGSAHVHLDSDAIDSWGSFWQDLHRAERPKSIVDALADRARLPRVHSLPPSTPAVLVYRTIAALLSQAAFGQQLWSCRNGYEDTSGYGGGVCSFWFEPFPAAGRRLKVSMPRDLLGQSAYRFWFLLRGQEPVLCLETTDLAWTLDGQEFQVPELYKRAGRRVWPVVFALAGHLLP